MQGVRHVPDLIKKQCAAMGGVDASDARLGSSREGAFGVAEEFGFQQGLWNGGAIDYDERLLSP